MRIVLAKFGLYLFIVLTALLGWTSLLATWAFFFAGPFDLLDFSMNRNAALAWDALLCVIFFLQHSGMMRKSFRRWLEQVTPQRYHGAIYTITSGITLLALIVLWQNSAYVVTIADGWIRYLLRGIFILSIAGIAWCIIALRSFDAFGLSPLQDYLKGSHRPEIPFTIRGPYRWVRHPLYLFSLLSIWSCPDLTLDRLMFNVLWTFWIVIGTMLEERDLVSSFGDSYRDYQQTVPMLIPYRLP